MNIILRLNNYNAERDLKKQMKKKNIKYEESPNFIFIDNVKELRHFSKTIDLIIENQAITIGSSYIRYMEVK